MLLRLAGVGEEEEEGTGAAEEEALADSSFPLLVQIAFVRPLFFVTLLISSSSHCHSQQQGQGQCRGAFLRGRAEALC